MGLNNKQLIATCIFAAMWSAVEIFLGSLLHQIPGKPIPTGMAAMIFAIPILTILYEITGNIKCIMIAGLITAILKLFSPGGAKFSPVISIMIETTVFSIFFYFISDKFKKLRIFIAGITASILGSTVGSFINSMIFGLFSDKTTKFILLLYSKRIITGFLGGIIGASIAIAIIKKLNYHYMLRKKEC